MRIERAIRKQRATETRVIVIHRVTNSTLDAQLSTSQPKARLRWHRRGGAQDDLPLENAFTLAIRDTKFDLVEVNEVLEKLAKKDSELVRIVELRFFVGLDVAETANVMNVSESTIKRGWATAKTWLLRELSR